MQIRVKISTVSCKTLTRTAVQYTRWKDRDCNLHFCCYQNCSSNYNTFWMVSENLAAILKFRVSQTTTRGHPLKETGFPGVCQRRIPILVGRCLSSIDRTRLINSVLSVREECEQTRVTFT